MLLFMIASQEVPKGLLCSLESILECIVQTLLPLLHALFHSWSRSNAGACAGLFDSPVL